MKEAAESRRKKMIVWLDPEQIDALDQAVVQRRKVQPRGTKEFINRGTLIREFVDSGLKEGSRNAG